MGGILVTADGTLATTGIKARLWQTTGLSSASDYDNVTSKWVEDTNPKCYTDTSETGGSCGTGINKPSAGTTRFFLNPGDGHTTVDRWFAAITGQTFSAININADTQY